MRIVIYQRSAHDDNDRGLATAGAAPPHHPDAAHPAVGSAARPASPRERVDHDGNGAVAVVDMVPLAGSLPDLLDHQRRLTAAGVHLVSVDQPDIEARTGRLTSATALAEQEPSHPQPDRGGRLPVAGHPHTSRGRGRGRRGGRW